MLSRQCIDANLCVAGLADPLVLVLRPVRNKQQQAGNGQTLNHGVEESLGLAVDPVEILDDEKERCFLTLPED